MINRLYEGADAFFNHEIYRSHLIKECVQVQEYDNATILPFKILEDGSWGGGLVTDENVFLTNTGVHNDSTKVYPYEAGEVTYVDEEVVFLGMFNGVWGHNITDDLRRLWIVNDEKYSHLLKDHKLVYIPIDGFRFSKSFLQLLECLGIDRTMLKAVSSLEKYKKVLLPDECFFKTETDTRYFTVEYKNLINTVKKYCYDKRTENSGIQNHKKIYFTYSKYKKNVSYGEKYLEDFFRNRGYSVIAPEDYDFFDQICLLKDCESLVTTVGSCSHNCIFLNDNAELILIPRTYCLTGYQIALNEVNSLKITWLDSSFSDVVQRNYPYMGPYCLGITDNLLKFYGLENEKLPEKLYLDMINTYCEYFAKCVVEYRKKNTQAPDYYKSAAAYELKNILQKGKISMLHFRMLQGREIAKYLFHKAIKKVDKNHG